MRKFLILLTLDLASKYLAAVIAPDNVFFKIHYNTKMAFNYDGGHFLTYVFPLISIPLVAIFLYKIAPKHMPLMFAGIIGNIFCRFLPCGVVDFINFQMFSNNFADIYMWVACGLMSLDGYKNYIKESHEISLKREKL